MGRASILSFTNLGYRIHARTFQPIDADLSGQTAVITGASGGLGKTTAGALAGLGARLIIIGRDEHALHAAAAEIGDGVVGIRADLSLMAEVRRLAGYLLDSEPRIQLLVNNVGVLLPERRLTNEGMEETLATNLAGHYLLTELLIPRLIESAPSRVVNVSSGGMYSERLRADDLQFEQSEYRGAAAYARTKRAQVVLTEMWAEGLADSGVVVHAMHPGWAKTPGVRRSLPRFNRIMKPLLRSARQGADTIVWLGAAGEPLESTGQFWFDRQVAPVHLSDTTLETADDRLDLWDRLAELTGLSEG
jgi:NAD(P)-dependent dehydrogenase (short-subunit alcohol dehydrogenase family)